MINLIPTILGLSPDCFIIWYTLSDSTRYGTPVEDVTSASWATRALKLERHVGFEPTPKDWKSLMPPSTLMTRLQLVVCVGFEPTQPKREFYRLLSSPMLRHTILIFTKLVGVVGFEPTFREEGDFKSPEYANFSTLPLFSFLKETKNIS